MGTETQPCPHGPGTVNVSTKIIGQQRGELRPLARYFLWGSQSWLQPPFSRPFAGFRLVRRAGCSQDWLAPPHDPLYWTHGLGYRAYD